MKKGLYRVITSFLIFSMALSGQFAAPFLAAAEASEALPTYCSKTPEQNAYLIIDGESDKITSKEDGDSLYLDIDSSMYSDADTEFLMSVVYYDYAEAEENFSLEYHKADGTLGTAAFPNTGKTEGWAVSTIGLGDIDLSKKYTSSSAAGKATMRIINSTDVEFGKIEFANLSQQKREGAASTTCLGNSKVLSLHKMNVPSKNASTFNGAQLGKQCSKYNATLLYNICTGQANATIPSSYKQVYLTQGELVGMFLDLFEISAGADALATAINAGLIETGDYFLYNSAPATNYNLACLAYNCIAYDPTPNDGNSELPVFKTMLENKILDGLGYEGVVALGNQAMLDTFIYGVKKYPYKTMTDGMFGETNSFGYVSYFGSQLLRPYFSQQQWSRDGKSFICTVMRTKNGQATNTQYLYSYNIETQTFRYIDTTNTNSGCVMGDDDYVYYVRRVRDGYGQFDIYKAPLDGSSDPEFVYRFRNVMWVGMIHITNDGRYLSFEPSMEPGVKMYEYPKGTTPIVRVDLQEKTDEVYTYHGFNYSKNLNHIQINPEYEDLMFFAHETVSADGFESTDILDRANVVNVETGERASVTPGQLENSDSAMLFFTHENWSYNGEYLYVTNLRGYDEYSPLNGIVRVNKDGTHRRFFYNRLIRSEAEGGWDTGALHTFPSGDDRYFALDNKWVSVMSAETNQIYPICATPVATQRPHPYHAHPTIARHKYIMNWGMVDEGGVLGISWFDFTHLDKTKLATGGRYAFGDDVENIRYHESRYYAPELSCDVNEKTFINGKTALHAESGKNIYFDINEDIVDSANDSVKITLEYYDDSTTPITITYTKGYETDNDLCRHENMTKQIQRTGTYTWKTAEVIIENGNFEDIGSYGTDFYVSSVGDTYISAVKVDRLDPSNVASIHFSGMTESREGYSFTGTLTRNKNTIKTASVYVASYNESGKLLNIKSTLADYKENSVAQFTVSSPSTGEESSFRFFVWADGKLTPYSEKVEVESFNLTATPAANGVKLNWDAVEGADSYEVYRDGKRIAITEDTSYNDKYFTVPELLDGDVMNEYTTPHNYIIKCANKVSRSVDAAIDPSLIKYVLEPTDVSLNFGDTSTQEYVAVVTAHFDGTGEEKLFSVATDNSGSVKTASYSNMNNKIEVFSALMGRATGISYKPSSQGYFKMPTGLTDDEYFAYVMRINACFGESGSNNLCFPENDGLLIKSIAFAKAEDYIY